MLRVHAAGPELVGAAACDDSELGLAELVSALGTAGDDPEPVALTGDGVAVYPDFPLQPETAHRTIDAATTTMFAGERKTTPVCRQDPSSDPPDYLVGPCATLAQNGSFEFS